jgi:hypothetical protein
MDSRHHARIGHTDVRCHSQAVIFNACNITLYYSRYSDEEQYVGQWLNDRENGIGMCVKNICLSASHQQYHSDTNGVKAQSISATDMREVSKM